MQHASKSAPAIETERLTLQGHTLADFEESAAMWADPVVTRYIGGRPSTTDASWSRLLRYAGLWALLGHGYWVVRERASGRFVGEVGLADFRRPMDPPLRDPEAGWALASWAHGRGFATEALRGALAWADAHLDAPRTVALVAPENLASLRVASKCGYREIGHAELNGAPTVVLERPRP